MRSFFSICLAFALSGTALVGPSVAEARTSKALVDAKRPAADVARDAARKPAEILSFARVKRDSTVLDFIMGGGYWTRLLATAVGPKGRVLAYQPAEFIAFRAAYGTEQDAVVKDYTNVTPLRPALATFALPSQPDGILTVQNYYDLHLNVAPKGGAERMMTALFHALEPDGTLLVVDHSAVAGAPLTVADTLHRIDPAIARAEIERAGFVFDGELPIYRNPADPRTTLVFDPSIRGKTDQFVYRFRKLR